MPKKSPKRASTISGKHKEHLISVSEFNKRLRKIPLPQSLDHEWQQRQKSFRYHAKHEGVEEFLKWSTIRATMFVGNSNGTQHKFDKLDSKWIEHLDDPGIGEPDMFNEYTSGNYIGQAYHLNVLEQHMDLSDVKSVIEFGGGYGTMRVIWHRAFGDEAYYLYDFPEFLLLQEYYISKVVDANTKYYTLKDKATADLCIAMASISESPIKDRDMFLKRNKAKKYFFSFQAEFYGIDNHKYFSKWAEENLREHSIIKAMPPTHWYLIGER